MSPNEILKEILEDPIFINKYGLTDKQLKSIELHKPCGIEVIEIIKVILYANSNNTKPINTFRQIKTLLGLS